MLKSKKARLLSPIRNEQKEIEANSLDSGIDTSNNKSLDESTFPCSLAGRIELLHMINFMCHSNLEVEFNDRITFVTGKNGSGKSTIMAALVVALGGTANTTGRGSGMMDFIKKGERWARVSVTLNNEGVNSYKRDMYGRRITITRELSKNTCSSYVCKSESGAVISRKKEEVDKICTTLDLQIKNPICILNQDVARSFLSATDNNIRYSMFMMSTHLENLNVIYSTTIDLLCDSQKELERKKLKITDASKDINQLKEKLEYFASLEKYVNEKTFLENELLWSLVIAEEKNLETLLEKKSKIKERGIKLADSHEDFDTVIKKLESDVEVTREKLKNLRNNQDGDKVKKKDLQTEIQNFQRQIDSANSRLKQLLMKSERQKSDITSIMDHLKQSEEVASQSQSEKEKIVQQRRKLEQDLSELRDRIDTTQRDTDNGLETKLQYTMGLENLNSDLKDLERLKRNKEIQKENTANVAQNTLLKYGQFTPKLKELIDDAAKKNRFLKKPVGPCGLYVTLSGDSKWARAAESVIGGLMGTYCCDNQKDFQELSRIMESVCGGKSPPVIISKFQNSRHNIASEKVSVRGLNTVLDVLQFSNDVVFNTFIDQARLETILLFETDAQAASLLSHIQNVPKNLRMGLTLQSDQYYPAPNYRTYYGDGNRPLKYFDAPVKSKAAMEMLDTEVKKIQLKIKEKNMEIAETTGKLVKVTEFLRKTESNLRLLKQNERKIESQINQLKDDEDSRPVLPTRVVLEEELAVLKRNEEEIQEKINHDRKSIESLTSDKEDRIRKMEDITKSENIFRAEFTKLQEKLESSEYALSVENDKKKNLGKQREEVESQLDKIRQEIRSKKETLSEKTKAASEVHEERIETNRSPAEVQKLLEKCEKYLQAAEKKLDSKEAVINEYKTKYQKYKEIKAKVEVLEKSVDSLTNAALSKKERFTLLQSHTANLVSFHFQACLQTRGYDGRLKFDFQNRTLQMEVIPKDGLLRKDTKTLSGGERSYSTVSFVLAIWRAVQMPFYFLDEFDVFMDKVNRKVIMDLLLEHAKNERTKQFIFITPQDISSIQTSSIVSVYRMPDPRQESR